MCTWDWLCICFVWYVPSPSVDWSWLPSMLCALMCGKTRSKSPLWSRRRLAECLLIVSLLFTYDIIVSLLFMHNISLMQVWTFFQHQSTIQFPVSAPHVNSIRRKIVIHPITCHCKAIASARRKDFARFWRLLLQCIFIFLAAYNCLKAFLPPAKKCFIKWITAGKTIFLPLYSVMSCCCLHALLVCVAKIKWTKSMSIWYSVHPWDGQVSQLLLNVGFMWFKCSTVRKDSVWALPKSRLNPITIFMYVSCLLYVGIFRDLNAGCIYCLWCDVENSAVLLLSVRLFCPLVFASL